jgi:hypothetical protein
MLPSPALSTYDPLLTPVYVARFLPLLTPSVRGAKWLSRPSASLARALATCVRHDSKPHPPASGARRDSARGKLRWKRSWWLNFLHAHSGCSSAQISSSESWCGRPIFSGALNFRQCVQSVQWEGGGEDSLIQFTRAGRRPTRAEGKPGRESRGEDSLFLSFTRDARTNPVAKADSLSPLNLMEY